ncbi:MAG: tRNA (guanosine(37)-N1)-methyltransferase TrmD [Eubacteriales bacterium]|nr:tRNA (guanosine(37)-N1)-methyltransferase TrmD [Eubacteriales bacterium]
MRFDIMTLFPEAVEAMLGSSIIGRARAKGILDIKTHNIRDYAFNKHKNVDDTPYGGGRGMLMATNPIYECYNSIINSDDYDFAPEKRRVVYMSPKGKILTQEHAKELLVYDSVIILCGHYEGVDQRIIDKIVDEEISVGDYVLSGGELPACILVDCISRMADGVLPSAECYEDESIFAGLLEYPQYTRPYEFCGEKVPDVLISGNHARIAQWRHEESLKITKERRPDMYEKYIQSQNDKDK